MNKAGSRYKYSQEKKFLKSIDNWRESHDIFNDHADFYCPSPKIMASSLVAFFKLDPDQLFAIPNIEKLTQESNHLTGSSNIDIPLLSYAHNGDLLPQYQQENITPLLIACWEGRKEIVQALLYRGANPNIQSSIQGYSALHLVISAPYDLSRKIDLIHILVQHNAILVLKDKNNDIILNLALRNKDVELTRFLLQKYEETTFNTTMLNFSKSLNYEDFHILCKARSKAVVI